jgi:hypothetical protein
LNGEENSMRKGLKNLVAVAVALLGFNAMAMAPTVSELPSPIIGDFNGVSGTNEFIFEDAFNLNSLVNDDFTTDGGILWSYWMDTSVNPQRYSINDAAMLGDSDSPVLPSTAQQLLANDDPASLDADSATVTLRDIILSPVGGPNVDPGAPGIVDSRVVTLWASDGTTATGKSSIFYTDNEGEDRFSGGFVSDVDLDFTGGDNGWTYNASLDGAMSEDLTGTGLCITAILSDVAIEGYRSDATTPYDLTDNSVYRMRAVLTTTAASGAVPAMQFVVNNTTADAVSGFGAGFAYGGEFIVVEAQGNANSIVNRTNGEYFWYFVPTQAQVSNWRSTTGGAFDAANDGVNDYRMEFNLIDVDGIGASETKAGTVCLTNLVIDRADIAALSRGSEVYGVTAFDATNFGGGQRILGTATFTAGNIVVASTSGVALVNLEPGTSTFDPTSTASFPIATTADTAYIIETSVTAGAGTVPIEIIRINADLPSNEIIQNTYGAATAGSALGVAALPTAGGSAETYTGFFFSHSTTASGSLPADAARASISIAQRTDVNGAAAPNATLTVESISVTPIN